MYTVKRIFFDKTRGARFLSELKPASVVSFLAVAVFFTGLMISGDKISLTVLDALQRCGKNLIPAILPSLIISDFLQSFLPASENKIAFSFFFGNFFGFPLGAKLLATFALSEDENAQKYASLIPLCCNPGFAFTVFGIGKGLWKSSLFGAALYACAVISATVTYVLFFKKSAIISPLPRDNEKETEKPAKKSFAFCLAHSIQNGCNGMLIICASVIFFSVFTQICKTLIGIISPCAFFDCLIHALFEISSADAVFINEAASAFGKQTGALLTFFSHGFGGLCIYFQILCFTERSPLRLRAYLPFKLIQGCLCALFGYLLFPYIL